MSTQDVLRNSGAYSIWGRIKSQPDLFFGVVLICILTVSYTHLTLPTLLLL